MPEWRTTDGILVTSVEQSGEACGQEIGNVWMRHQDDWLVWPCRTVARALELVHEAPRYTAAEFEAIMDAVAWDGC